jgi:hypothetical protein
MKTQIIEAIKIGLFLAALAGIIIIGILSAINYESLGRL